jgi:hypothetical protein
MARIGRLAGALLVEHSGAYHLVGQLKEPCDFAAAGLARPEDLDARAARGVALEAIGPVRLAAPWLEVDLAGDALISLLAERLIVARTGLASERLWNLISHEQPGPAIDARWVTATPPHVWALVRDAVLRCA